MTESRILNEDQRAILDQTDHDESTGLSLYHYKIGFPYTGDLAEWGRIRGIVVGRENKILYEFFPKHTEWSAGDATHRPISENVQDYDVFLAVEGALLRLFYHDGRWFLTTNRRLDAFQSRWSSKYSFGEMFEYALKHMFPEKVDEGVIPYFYSTLDPSMRYTFLIRFNNDNRIVCRVQNIELKDRLIFLGVFREGSSVLEHAHDQFNDHPTLSRLGRQKWLSSAGNARDSFGEWENYILQHIDPLEYPGVILIHKTVNRQLKIVHPRYAELAWLRGNQPNLAIRYLELRERPEDLEKFVRLYNRHSRMFHQLEEMIKETARRINFWYAERHVHNRFVSVPFPEYNIMKKCHQWYLEDPQNRRVYIRIVTEFLNRESPLSLYRILNRMRQDARRSSGDTTTVGMGRWIPSHKRIIRHPPPQTIEVHPPIETLNPPASTNTDMNQVIDSELTT